MDSTTDYIKQFGGVKSGLPENKKTYILIDGSGSFGHSSSGNKSGLEHAVASAKNQLVIESKKGEQAEIILWGEQLDVGAVRVDTKTNSKLRDIILEGAKANRGLNCGSFLGATVEMLRNEMISDHPKGPVDIIIIGDGDIHDLKDATDSLTQTLKAFPDIAITFIEVMTTYHPSRGFKSLAGDTLGSVSGNIKHVECKPENIKNVLADIANDQLHAPTTKQEDDVSALREAFNEIKKRLDKLEAAIKEGGEAKPYTVSTLTPS